jgi:hypothetical protein
MMQRNSRVLTNSGTECNVGSGSDKRMNKAKYIMAISHIHICRSHGLQLKSLIEGLYIIEMTLILSYLNNILRSKSS